MSPSRAPPGDAVLRCRDTIEAVSGAPGHKYNRERCELLQLLTLPHLQVRKSFVLYPLVCNNILGNFEKARLT